MPAEFRILVTGSRDWVDHDTIGQALTWAVEQAAGQPVRLVVGGARGADHYAERIWRRWSAVRPDRYLDVEVHPADWDRYGRSAGHRRNAEMVKAGADLCIAFPLGASRGTRGCMDLAVRAGIPVHEFGASGE